MKPRVYKDSRYTQGRPARGGHKHNLGPRESRRTSFLCSEMKCVMNRGCTPKRSSNAQACRRKAVHISIFLFHSTCFALMVETAASDTSRATVGGLSDLQRKFSLDNININNVVRGVMQRNSSVLAAAATAAGISAGVSLLQRAAANIASRQFILV